MKPIVINVEASGKQPGAYPIEVGVVMEDGGSYCVLVKPEADWTHWDPEAEKCHGLQRDLLFRCGQSVTTVANQLNTLLEGRVVYSNAWAQDACWLDMLFAKAGCERRFSVDSLRNLLTERQFLHWHKAKEEVLKILKLPRRRASADARVLQLAVEECLSLYRAMELA